MWPLVIGLACGVIGAIGAKLVIDSHRTEQASIKVKVKAQEDLIASIALAQKGQADLSSSLALAQADLSRTNAELLEARRRADALADLNGRRAQKAQRVSALIGTAIDEGTARRNALDTALNAIVGNEEAERELNERFDQTHLARSVETWRGNTAMMLDRELPGFGLRDAFSNVGGARGVGPARYRLSQVIACNEYLTRLLGEVSARVEQLTQR